MENFRGKMFHNPLKEKPDMKTNRVSKTVAQQQESNDEGMATAEYAMVTLAAVAFAGLLLTVLTSNEVRTALVGLIQDALSN